MIPVSERALNGMFRGWTAIAIVSCRASALRIGFRSGARWLTNEKNLVVRMGKASRVRIKCWNFEEGTARGSYRRWLSPRPRRQSGRSRGGERLALNDWMIQDGIASNHRPARRTRMRILYFETTAYYPSSAHFFESLREVAAETADWSFEFIDEAPYVDGQRSIPNRIASRLIGRRPLSYWAFNRAVLDRARSFEPDAVLIGKGQYLSPRTLQEIKKRTGAELVNWSTDDPFNPLNSTADLVASIPLYDLYVLTKRAVIPDLERHGARHVAYVRFGYKAGVHYPEQPGNEDEARRFSCDVAFIGGADADRVPYFENLLREMPELRLNLYGGFWNHYAALRPYWRGEAVAASTDWRSPARA
jgi:hypothetical protein